MNFAQLAKAYRTRTGVDVVLASTAAARPSNVLPYTAGDVLGSNSGAATPAATVTISNATPGVITWGGGSPVAHGLTAGQAVMFKTAGGTIAAGLADDTVYYVLIPEANPTTTFNVEASVGGGAIATSGTGTGTTTCAKIGSAVWEFANMAVGGDCIELLEASLHLAVNAVPSGMTSFRLHLYSAAPPSALLDNAAWDLASGDAAAYLGFIDLGTPADMGAALYAETSNLRKFIVTAATSVYGYLVTAGAYTPASGTTATIKIMAGSI